MTATSLHAPQSTRQSWGAVLAMSLAAFALVASEFMPVSLLTPIAADLHISEGQAGQGIAVSGLFALLTSLGIASVAARVERKRLLLSLTLLMIVSGSVVAFAPNYATFMAGRALIGVAIGGGKGLVVPVLRNAERMSFAEIEIAIGDLATRAKENKLKPDELQGGTFTISNGGVYGSLLSTPIVNPPQSGILGMHTIQERPVAVEGQVVIRPMMYVALSYDHRIVDGREAVTFLKAIKEYIEKPARILLEV